MSFSIIFEPYESYENADDATIFSDWRGTRLRPCAGIKLADLNLLLSEHGQGRQDWDNQGNGGKIEGQFFSDRFSHRLPSLGRYES